MSIVIAELCQNHNGDQTILNEMVHAAAESGADYAKIQSMLADDLPHRPRFDEGVRERGRQVAIKRPYQAEYDRLKPMDLDDEAHYAFIDECTRAGIKPMTTAFSRSRVPFLASLGFDAIKVASYDCASEPFLRELKEQFDHLYISTGATFDHEIKRAAKVLAGHSFTFLHCVTVYPTPLNQMHLARIDYLRQFTPSVGFSDHSLVARDGLKASAVAIYLGAEVVERHFNILEPDEARDGPVSINPAQLADLVQISRMTRSDLGDYIKDEVEDYSMMLGSRTRDLTEIELLNRDYYRGRFASRNDNDFVFNWEDRPYR